VCEGTARAGLCAGLAGLHVLKTRRKHVQGQTSFLGAATALKMLDSPGTISGWAVGSQDFAEEEMPAKERSSPASGSAHKHRAMGVCCVAWCS